MGKGLKVSHERRVALLDSVHDDLQNFPRQEQRRSDSERSPLERERDQQATFHEWQATVERFELLADAFLAGHLPADLERTFADLTDQFQHLLPTVDRLGLQRPSETAMEQVTTRRARSVA